MKLNPVLVASILLPFSAWGGEFRGTSKESKVVEAHAETGWEFKLAVPSWIAAVRGDTGVNGRTSHSNTGFNELANKIDMVGSLRAEAGFGQFGILGDFSYLSISDSIGVDRAIRKLDFRQDQILGDLGLRWRVIDTPRGWLDVIGGVRYTYLYEEIGLQADGRRIGAIADRLAAAGTLLRVNLARELLALSGDDPHFSIPALGSQEAQRLARAIDRLKGTTADRAAAIDKLLRKALNRKLTRTDDWFDPYIGLRGRCNLNDTWYVTAKADISPFDVGADFAWQASAGFGCQLSKRMYGEVVYRILDVDYRHDGLIYDVTTHGPELTLGLNF